MTSEDEHRRVEWGFVPVEYPLAEAAIQLVPVRPALARGGAS
jgi:hypothetical protein